MQKISIKFGINFVHFAWTKLSEMKPRVNIALKNVLDVIYDLPEVENVNKIKSFEQINELKLISL